MVQESDDSENEADEMKGGHEHGGALESKRSIAELRPMLKKWIQSFVTPTFDDVNSVANYFQNLVRENNLPLVYSGLKCLCRQCLNCEYPENWSGAYNFIIREVQTVMLKVYKKRLSVNFKF